MSVTPFINIDGERVQIGHLQRGQSMLYDGFLITHTTDESLTVTGGLNPNINQDVCIPWELAACVFLNDQSMVNISSGGGGSTPSGPRVSKLRLLWGPKFLHGGTVGRI